MAYQGEGGIQDLRARLAAVEGNSGGGALVGIGTITAQPGDKAAFGTIAATGVTSNKLVLAWLASTGPADENEPEWLSVNSISAAAGSDTVTVSITFAEPVSGEIKINWSAF